MRYQFDFFFKLLIERPCTFRSFIPFPDISPVMSKWCESKKRKKAFGCFANALTQYYICDFSKNILRVYANTTVNSNKLKSYTRERKSRLEFWRERTSNTINTVIITCLGDAEFAHWPQNSTVYNAHETRETVLRLVFRSTFDDILSPCKLTVDARVACFLSRSRSKRFTPAFHSSTLRNLNAPYKYTFKYQWRQISRKRSKSILTRTGTHANASNVQHAS